MKQSIEIMVDRIKNILSDNKISIYLFGSVTLDDFKLGWSDIDILVLTENTMSKEQAEELVNLRQTLLEEYPNNKYFRLFEGGILSIDAFLNNKQDRVVYWGTSGQRITQEYCFDTFSIMELKDSGILLCGRDIRNEIQYPSYSKMIDAVQNHYQTIRQYAVKTGRDLYSAGWMLDIARCLYTLSEKKIISKTKAGYWAIEQGFVPNVKLMNEVLAIREHPLDYKGNKEIQDWLETLGTDVQKFADLLDSKLGRELNTLN